MASLYRPRPKCKKIASSSGNANTDRRHCYMCKMPFVPDIPLSEEEIKTYVVDDDLPTPLHLLIPLAQQGLKEMCTYYHIDQDTVLNKQSLDDKTGTFVKDFLPVNDAFCLLCVRHLAHVGRMKEDIECLTKAKLQKLEALGELMTVMKEKHRYFDSPPKKKKKLALERKKDKDYDSDQDSMAGEDTPWAELRKGVVKNYIETYGNPIVKVPEPYVHEYVDLISSDSSDSSSSDDDEPVQSVDNAEADETDKSSDEAAKENRSSGYQSDPDDDLSCQFLDFESIKPTHLQKAQQLRHHFTETDGHLICSKCGAWVTRNKVPVGENAETKILMHIFDKHFPEFHNL
ncbi:uncharacterized protein LOC110843689 [Folsomia candida]|uniref:uncharacterized protein LOC110843689 n=1 Tax=Folsomia candida TaxID=158441 RepID=UPI000B8F7E4A|nr:uncharacterized protein LOC110843689 [Folsomia candida]